MSNIVTEKRCKDCGEMKTVDKFAKDKRNKDGMDTRCILCDRKWYMKYRINNRERINESQRKYSSKHTQGAYERLRIWIQRNPERRKETVKINNAKYRLEHPDKRLINQENRRARIKGNGGIITNDEWMELKKKYNYTCLCCKRKEPEIRLSVDHIIPISLGGKNSIDNAQPLCRLCNSKKQKRIIDYR